ncbi:C-type lectin mannose-binding isoform-like [Rhagoletis pomonella]|uniref:C-type lectin mannose-binding isoform-like n=1 Tax=Rhagoletis pomonella TaxID=28610 RepID=UPI00177D9CAF|nr:C-type lectin mannose-binding isoform-like [Rhagoletis pomonella]
MKVLRKIVFALVLIFIIVATAVGQNTESYSSEIDIDDDSPYAISTDTSTDINDDFSDLIGSAEQTGVSKENVRAAPPYLLNDNYIVTLAKLNWHAAHAFCDQNNWSLLRIETPMQQFEVQTYLNFFNLQGNDFWIAGNNFADLRNFRWDYDGPSFRYSNWAFGQPENYRNGEHCVKLLKNSLQWGDDSCDNTYHFICQRYNNTNITPKTPH